jgi:hypothetical protein
MNEATSDATQTVSHDSESAHGKSGSFGLSGRSSRFCFTFSVLGPEQGSLRQLQKPNQYSAQFMLRCALLPNIVGPPGPSSNGTSISGCVPRLVASLKERGS